MKYFLLIISLFIINTGTAQNIGGANSTLNVLGGMQVNQAFRPPVVSPIMSPFTKGIADWGQIVIDPGDSTLKYWYRGTWSPLTASGSGFVPYAGASSNVTLGTHTLTAGGIDINGSPGPSILTLYGANPKIVSALTNMTFTAGGEDMLTMSSGAHSISMGTGYSLLNSGGILSTSSITCKGGLTITGSSSGGVSFLSSASGASYDLNFPNAQGAANTALVNDGSGNFTWVAPAILANSNTFTGTTNTFKHIKGSGTPTIAVNTSNAGVGATASIEGTDMAGTIIITTGSSGVGGAGDFATVTFGTAYSTAPYVTISPLNEGAIVWMLDPSIAVGFQSAAPLRGSTTTGFQVRIYQAGILGPVPTNSQIQLVYHVIQ